MKLHFDRHPRPQSLSPQHVQFFKNSRQLHQMRIATGKKFKEPQTDTAFSRVWNMIQQSRSPVFHAIGNHELYNFKPSQLRDQFNEEGGAQVETTLHSYHVRTNTTSYLHNTRKKSHNFKLVPHIGNAAAVFTYVVLIFASRSSAGAMCRRPCALPTHLLREMSSITAFGAQVVVCTCVAWCCVARHIVPCPKITKLWHIYDAQSGPRMDVCYAERLRGERVCKIHVCTYKYANMNTCMPTI